jgi:hypothetical protein
LLVDTIPLMSKRSVAIRHVTHAHRLPSGSVSTRTRRSRRSITVHCRSKVSWASSASSSRGSA